VQLHDVQISALIAQEGAGIPELTARLDGFTRNLILETVPITTPVDDAQSSNIQDCRSIARVRALLHPDCFRTRVSSVKRRLMTASTAHVSVYG
jgi:hypothetical protein